MNRRDVLWRNQSGRCYFCKRETILPGRLVESWLGMDHGWWDDLLPQERGDLVRDLINQDGFKARWGDDLATIEHVIPLARGGSNRLSNTVMACARCNHTRGAQMDRQMKKNNRRQHRVSDLVGMRWSVENDCWVPISPGGFVPIGDTP